MTRIGRALGSLHSLFCPCNPWLFNCGSAPRYPLVAAVGNEGNKRGESNPRRVISMEDDLHRRGTECAEKNLSFGSVSSGHLWWSNRGFSASSVPLRCPHPFYWFVLKDQIMLCLQESEQSVRIASLDLQRQFAALGNPIPRRTLSIFSDHMNVILMFREVTKNAK
jgi:hypothetical protein